MRLHKHSDDLGMSFVITDGAGFDCPPERGCWFEGDESLITNHQRRAMKVRFAVDFDGTLVEDDKYPAMGEWIPGAADAVRSLERLGTVVIYSCRAAPADVYERPRCLADRDRDVEMIRAKLAEEHLEHLEIWTKPYKPPAAAYIDNKGIAFRGDWNRTLEDVLDLIAPITPLYVPWEEIRDLDDSWMTLAAVEWMSDEKPDDLVWDTEPDEEPEETIQVEGSLMSPEMADVVAERAKVDEYRKRIDQNFYWLSSDITRHPASARFHSLLEEAGELHDQKQQDYGRGDDPFANVRASADWGMPSWVGAMVRATDKVKRLQTFARKGELANESVIDAFMDLAVYALIARVLYEEEL